MSKIFVDQVDPKTATTLTLGTSGDTVNIPSGVTIANAGTATGFGVSLANGADNRVVTSSSTTALNGEANLTYDGTTLLLSQASPILKVLPTTNGNSGVLEVCGRSTDGSPTENRTQIKGTPEGSTANTKMTFHTENSSGVNERMSIDSTGNIDTTIAGNGTSGISFKTTTDHTANDKAYIGSHTSSGYGVNLVISRGGSDGFASETARFRNDGIVLINTNDTLFGGNILQIYGKNDAEVVAIQVATNGKKAIQFANASGVEAGSIVTSSSSTAFNTSSDYRLKENETPITDGITRLKTLKPYRFNFKTDPDETVDGFFAHEVSNVIPEAITGTKDAMHPEVLYADKVLYTAEDDLPEGMNIGDIKTSADELPEGKNFGDVKEATKINPQSIDQSKLVPLLVASVQELIAENETLKTRITALENA